MEIAARVIAGYNTVRARVHPASARVGATWQKHRDADDEEAPVSTSSSEGLEDPGRDPKGLNPPRNPFGGAEQDSGRGRPRGTGDLGPAGQPGVSTDEPDRASEEPGTQAGETGAGAPDRP